NNLFTERLMELDLDYTTMHKLSVTQVPFQQSAGYIAAEAVTPYPPGIPLILKGERITRHHIRILEAFHQQGVHFQHLDINNEINVFQIRRCSKSRSNSTWTVILLHLRVAKDPVSHLF